MISKINCKFNNNGAWCTNKNIKRSLLGIGARCCSEYPYINKKCEFKEFRTKKRAYPPAPIKERLEVEDLIEFDFFGEPKRGYIQIVGKHGYWVDSGGMGNGSIRCPFDDAILIKKHNIK